MWLASSILIESIRHCIRQWDMAHATLLHCQLGVSQRGPTTAFVIGDMAALVSRTMATLVPTQGRWPLLPAHSLG